VSSKVSFFDTTPLSNPPMATAILKTLPG